MLFFLDSFSKFQHQLFSLPAGAGKAATMEAQQGATTAGGADVPIAAKLNGKSGRNRALSGNINFIGPSLLL